MTPGPGPSRSTSARNARTPPIPKKDQPRFIQISVARSTRLRARARALEALRFEKKDAGVFLYFFQPSFSRRVTAPCAVSSQLCQAAKFRSNSSSHSRYVEQIYNTSRFVVRSRVHTRTRAAAPHVAFQLHARSSKASRLVVRRHSQNRQRER